MLFSLRHAVRPLTHARTTTTRPHKRHYNKAHAHALRPDSVALVGPISHCSKSLALTLRHSHASLSRRVAWSPPPPPHMDCRVSLPTRNCTGWSVLSQVSPGLLHLLLQSAVMCPTRPFQGPCARSSNISGSKSKNRGQHVSVFGVLVSRAVSANCAWPVLVPLWRGRRRRPPWHRPLAPAWSSTTLFGDGRVVADFVVVHRCHR